MGDTNDAVSISLLMKMIYRKLPKNAEVYT